MSILLATSFYLTSAQFKFLRAQRPEYLAHRRNKEERSRYLQTLWRTFLVTYPEHDIPPFPEDDEMVERFHLSRATVRAPVYPWLSTNQSFTGSWTQTGQYHRVRSRGSASCQRDVELYCVTLCVWVAKCSASLYNPCE